MKSRAELESRLSVTRDWLDENENSGASEVGIELGWEQALEWVLGQM